MEYLVSYGKQNPNVAYIYALTGNSSLSVVQILFKEVYKYISPFQALFFRSLIVTLINIILLKKQGKSPYIKSLATFKMVLIRVSLTTTALSIMLYCIKFIPVSMVTTLRNLGPIFIFFIEAVNYQHSIPTFNMIATLLSFFGVVLIMQPSFLFGQGSIEKVDGYYLYRQSFHNNEEEMVILDPQLRPEGPPNIKKSRNKTSADKGNQTAAVQQMILYSLMLISAFCNSMNMLFIHGIGKRLDPLIGMYYSNIGSVAISAILCNITPQQTDLHPFDWKIFIVMFMVGIFAFLAQTFIFLANTIKKPSLMMPFGYIGVSITFLADVYLFDTQFTLLPVIGIFLTSSGLLSGYLIQVFNKQPEQPIEKVTLKKHLLSLTTVQSTPQKQMIEMNEIVTSEWKHQLK